MILLSYRKNKILFIARFTSVYPNMNIKSEISIKRWTIASMTPSSGVNSQPSSLMIWAVFPVILLVNQWFNAYNNFIISSMIIQISLQYNSTICTTSLYSTPLAITITPVLSITIDTMTHRLLALPRFSYRSTQLLLLYTMVRPKYGNVANLSRGYKLTFIHIWLSLKHCCRVSFRRWWSLPRRHFLGV